jgi:hypothetical protein
MIAARDTAVPSQTGWRLLLRLLALPLAASAVLIGVWLAGGPEPGGRTANAHLALAMVLPLSTTWAVIRLLQRGSERALVLPTPLMMWLVSASQHGLAAPSYAVVIAHAGALALLTGCLQRKRRLAHWGAICCGAAAIWLQSSALTNHG